jgi:DMSO reductase anchor subunit
MRRRSLGVFCSIMIYHDTRRAFWRFGPTMVKFTLTAAVLGLATVLLAQTFDAMVFDERGAQTAIRAWGKFLCLSLAGCSVAKLAVESCVLRHLKDRKHTPNRRTAVLLIGSLAHITLARIAFGLLGGVILPLLLAADAANDVSHGALRFAAPAIGAIFLLTLLGELAERYLFFAAVVAPRMPGGHT